MNKQTFSSIKWHFKKNTGLFLTWLNICVLDALFQCAIKINTIFLKIRIYVDLIFSPQHLYDRILLGSENKRPIKFFFEKH